MLPFCFIVRLCKAYIESVWDLGYCWNSLDASAVLAKTFGMEYLSMSPYYISDSLQKGGLSFRAADYLQLLLM